MSSIERSELEQRDELMAVVLPLAASQLAKHPEKASFLESLIESALATAIERQVPEAKVKQTGHTRIGIPTWGRALGNFDLQVSLPGEEQPSVLIETKVDDVSDQLWDLFKLTSVPLMPGGVVGYLVAAAARPQWEKGSECLELYADDPPMRVWEAGRMFLSWRRSWNRLLGGGSARPLSIPRRVETKFIGAAEVAAFPTHEVRCIRVRPFGDGRIPFVGDWPRYGEEGDVPDPAAEERLNG